MRVLLAGASGTLARALVPQLRAAGHDAVALAHSPSSAERLRGGGLETIVADALDRDGLLRAVTGVRADAVMHQLTALKSAPTHYRSMRRTNELRTVGTSNLLEAARAVGARRFLTQSIVFGYGFRRRQAGLLDESAPFGEPEGGGVDPTLAALRSTEQQVLGAAGIEGISLRYGLFYGLDAPTMSTMLRRRMLPVTDSTGLIPVVHHEDAASATVAALEHGIPGGVYNVAADEPVTWRRHAETAAAAFGAPPPLRVPVGLLRVLLPYAGELMTRIDLRVSSERAHRELGWSPRFGTVEEGWRAAAAA